MSTPITPEERAKTIQTIIAGSQKLDNIEKAILSLINIFEDVKLSMAQAFEKIGTDIPKIAKIYIVRNDMGKFKKLIALLKGAKEKVAIVIRNTKDLVNCQDMLDDNLKEKCILSSEMPKEATPHLILFDIFLPQFQAHFKDYKGFMHIILSKLEYENKPELQAELEKYQFLIEISKEI